VGAGVPPAQCGRDGRTHNGRTHSRTHKTIGRTHRPCCDQRPMAGTIRCG